MIPIVERVLFLRGVPLFRGLSGEELVRVAAIAEEVVTPADGWLVREGELGDALYLVVRGRVSIEKGTRAVAELGPRECVGELALLDAEPRSASARALGEVLALRLERAPFLELIDERPELARGILRILAQRLRETTARTTPR
jgi:CRP-like cAMP-binding protein